jgi:UDP-N-acetylmuramoyl-L-alanyl-D-glutamate--2,6-diaminopimelate ligase
MARWFVDRLPQRGIPSVSLRGLLPEGIFVGRTDWEVTGCSHDHRRLEPGQVFVAIRESKTGYDGHAFVREALDRGAAGVVVERPCSDAGRLQVVVPDALAAYARICHALAGDPSQQLSILGVTGSFGRAITALMVHAILKAAGKQAGCITSLGFCNGDTMRQLGAGFGAHPRESRPGSHAGTVRHGSRIHSFRTSEMPGVLAPGVAGMSALLAEMAEHHCEAGVLEMSCDSLVQRCSEGIAFHAAIVTDISVPTGFPPEILTEKRRAKAKLFRQVVRGGVAVVNADDPHAETLGGVSLDTRRVAFALEPVTSPWLHPDITARLIQLDGSGTRMVLHGFDREAVVHVPLVAPRVATCALAAATLGWALEIDRAAIVAGLESVNSVAGCLEPVSEGQDFDVRIDPAQTPAALDEALAALRAIAAGRVHCVLSAEGNGDRRVRRWLAETAEAGADRIILTVSNPRTENPDQILDDLLAGLRRPGKARVEPDRQTAIEAALSDARRGDTVLITGKGRQTYQILADCAVPFDDAAIARSWLRAHNTHNLLIKSHRSA